MFAGAGCIVVGADVATTGGGGTDDVVDVMPLVGPVAELRELFDWPGPRLLLWLLLLILLLLLFVGLRLDPTKLLQREFMDDINSSAYCSGKSGRARQALEAETGSGSGAGSGAGTET